MHGCGMPRDRELDQHWQAVLGRLAFSLGEGQLRYLRGSHAASLVGDTLSVAVRSRFAAEWLPQKVGEQIDAEVEAQWGRALRVAFVPPADGSVPAALEIGSAPAPPGPGPKLHPDNTFERYMVADGNRFAFEAITSLAGPDGPMFSPLVVVGSPGLGKTHLLHAFARECQAQGSTVVLLAWNDFINAFTRGLRDGTADDFKRRVREASVLIVDDLRDAGPASKSADELLHAIDAIDVARGRILVSAERPPRELDLPPALASRLEHGLIVPVSPFDAAERHEFARRYCAERDLDLPAWAVERICAMELGSVRTLRAALNGACVLWRSGRLDLAALDLALALLTVNEAATGRAESLSAVVERVARYFGFGPADLQGPSREAAIAEARAAAAAALRRRGLSMSEVGAHLGRKKQTMGPLIERGERLLTMHPDLAAQVAS